mgnify:FL=1
MGEWVTFKNAGFEQASINEDNLKEYKNEIIERLNKKLDCKRYVERLLKDKNNDVFDKSLTAIDVFLEFREKHENIDSLVGKDGNVPMLEYDPYSECLVLKYVYSNAQKKHLKALSNILCSDNKSRERIVSNGEKILKDFRSVPKYAQPIPFLDDAKLTFTRLSPYLQGKNNPKGYVFTYSNGNGQYLLDFVSYLGAKCNKKVACLSSGETFSRISLTLGKDESAMSYLEMGKNADILCLYNLEALPTNKNFIESVFIPFLSMRKSQGKITFGCINDSLATFVGGLSPLLSTRKQITTSLNSLMDELKTKEDQLYF